MPKAARLSDISITIDFWAYKCIIDIYLVCAVCKKLRSPFENQSTNTIRIKP